MDKAPEMPKFGHFAGKTQDLAALLLSIVNTGLYFVTFTLQILQKAPVIKK